MYSLCHSERPFVILSASEESAAFSKCHFSDPFTRHVCRQPSTYALYGILHAHFSVFLLTSAQTNLDSRFVRHPPCALLRISPDICAGNPPSKPYFQLSLHTSQPLNRHVRWQTLTHALSGILHAHFPAFPMTSAQTIPLPRRIFNFSCALLGIHRFPRSFTPFRDNGNRFEVTDPSLRLVSVQDDRNAAAFRMAGDAI